MMTVIYGSPWIPAEWIAAHGLRPSWLRLRSADDDPLLGVIRGVCPYARAFLHAVLSHKEASAVVLTTTCDQMRHAAAVVDRNCDLPLFLMNVPSTWQTAAAGNVYLDELKRLGRFLVRLGGRVASHGDLADVMLEYDRGRSAVRAARARLSARRFAEAVAELRGDGRLAPDIGSDAERTGGIPLALVGGPLLEKDYAILDRIEGSGGRVVLDATESGERTMPAPFDRERTRNDPLKELAGAYFGAIPDAFRRPNTRFYEWLEREVTARQVGGILFRRYVWCDIWHAELYRLKQWSPVPVLDVDACYEDHGSLSRTLGRVEAFLEMLESQTQ